MVGLAFAGSTVVNVIANPVAEWLPMPFMAAFVGFASYWGMRAILSFQKVNSLTIRRELGAYVSSIFSRPCVS